MENNDCSHRHITTYGQGWVCCACKEPLLSLMVPIPIKTIVAALEAVTKPKEN